MPIYSYRCGQCDREADSFARIEDRDNGPACCGAAMARQLSAPMVMVPGGTDFAYQCQVTGENVQSMRKRKYIMEKHGLADARDYSATWAKQRETRARENAEAKAHYASLPDSVKKAAAATA